MRYRLRTLMIVGLAGTPTFHALAFAAKYAGAPAALIYVLVAAVFVCLALPIVCGILLVARTA